MTTRLIVRYVRQRAGEDGVVRLRQLAGEERSIGELEDESSWSSYRQKIALFESAAEVCADPLAARRIGESVLHEQVGLPIRMILWTLGSPAQIYRNVAKAAPKFSTAATLTCVETGRSSATVTYRVHPEHAASRHDCEYTHGLLSQAPALFGLPAASVEHQQCQAQGDDRCVFHLRWARRRRMGGRRQRTVRYLETELQTLMAQVESLERTVSGLVVEDIDDTLRRITIGAGAAVRASAHLLAVRPLARSDVFLHAVGLDESAADDLAERLADRHQIPDGHDGSLVVDVASSHRFYGRLAAVYPEGHPFWVFRHECG